MIPNLATSTAEVALVIQSAVAPVFLLAGIGAFLTPPIADIHTSASKPER